MPLTQWDIRFLALASHIAEWSKDSNAKIGAVLVDSGNRVIATGFNGLPTSITDLPVLLNDAPTKNDMIVHAEQNAIMSADAAAKGGTIYVSGKPVCSKCAGAIIQSGVKRVVACEPKDNTPSKWDKSGMVTKQMFEMASIEFVATG